MYKIERKDLKGYYLIIYQMPDYQQGKIYRLVSNKTEDVYYGATTRALTHRLNHHKKDLRCSSRKLFENDAVVTIVLIELFPCNSKMELNTRELFYITNNPCININKPFITDKQIIGGDSEDWRKEYVGKYYEKNKEQIIEYQKEYWVENKEIISEKNHNSRMNNIEVHKERDKNKYQRRKDVIADQNKTQLFDCPCGKLQIRVCSSARHIKSIKHQEFLKQ